MTTTLRFEFEILGGTTTTPQRITTEAHKIATAYFDVIEYELVIVVSVRNKQYYGACVATADMTEESEMRT